MPTQIILGFQVNTAQPIDDRTVSSGLANRLNIPYKYTGLRVYDPSDGFSYVWTGTTFSSERTNQVIGNTNSVPKFTSQYIIGSSNIFATGSRVGINTTNPLGDLQIGDLSGAISTIPLVIQKNDLFGLGATLPTVIGNNWYYDGAEQSFNSGRGSTTLNFGRFGDLSVKVRNSGAPFSSQKQGIYVSRLGRVGIGDSWSSSFSPLYQLDVDGVMRSNDRIWGKYLKITNTDSPTSEGIVLYDPTLVGTSGKQGLFIDWSNLNIPADPEESFYAGISGFSRGSAGGELRFYTSEVHQPIAGTTSDRPVRMTISNNGFVGIGTTTPSNLLTVNGTASATTLIVSNGTYNSPSISFANDTDSGIMRVNYNACPDPETNILLSENKIVKAKDLKVGDLVYTINESNLEWGNFKVTHVSENIVEKKLKINFEDGTELKVTDTHRFLTENNAWVNANKLSIGDNLKSVDGIKTIGQITDIGSGKVIKIEVEEAHTYISEGIISHNYKVGGYNSGGVVFVYGGQERMRITHVGTIGVGTDTPEHYFDINGTASVNRLLARDGTGLKPSIAFTNGLNYGLHFTSDTLYKTVKLVLNSVQMMDYRYTIASGKLDLIANIHNTGNTNLAATLPSIASGTRLVAPTAFATTGWSSIQSTGAEIWTRVGNVVSVSGKLTLQPSSVGNNAVFSLSIPIPTVSTNFSGMFKMSNVSDQGPVGHISAAAPSGSPQSAEFKIYTTWTSSNRTAYYSYTYLVADTSGGGS